MLSDPPASDEIEVSIFGPGKGESILVHLGDNRWITVDSCVDQRTREIPALAYLERIGVVAEQAVELVVATHAHDDHFAGISKIFEKCKSAKFVCPVAITKEEFMALRKVDEQGRGGLRKRAYAEYSRVFQLIRDRSSDAPDFRPLKWAIEQRTLITESGSTHARVTALSPSDEALTRSRIALKSAYPDPGSDIKAINIDPNELAIALWVDAGGKSILLGADLSTGPEGCGWIAVLASFAPSTKASLYKVAHHGSIIGDHDEIWSNLVQPKPTALLAPFRAGKKRLPSREDCSRILALTTQAFITANPRTPALSKQAKREAAALGPLAQNPREPWGIAGHVRARSRLGADEWTVTLATPGQRLTVG